MLFPPLLRCNAKVLIVYRSFTFRNFRHFRKRSCSCSHRCTRYHWAGKKKTWTTKYGSCQKWFFNLFWIPKMNYGEIGEVQRFSVIFESFERMESQVDGDHFRRSNEIIFLQPIAVNSACTVPTGNRCTMSVLYVYIVHCSVSNI